MTTAIATQSCPGCGAAIRKQPDGILALPNPEPFIHETAWCDGCGGSADRLSATSAEVNAYEILKALDAEFGSEDRRAELLLVRLRRAVNELVLHDHNRPEHLPYPGEEAE